MYFFSLIFLGWSVLAQTMIPPPQLSKEELAAAISNPLALEVEGVYHSKAKIPKAMGPTEVRELLVSIIQSARTGNLNLTIASDTGSIFFYASQILYQRSQNLIEIESFGVNFKGVRQYMKFEVDPIGKTIAGTVEGNFLETTEKIYVLGKKKNSLFESLDLYGSANCGSERDYLGSFSGHMFRGGETLTIHEIPSKDGEKVLSANVSGSTKIIYHDGFFSKELGVVQFVNDITYPMNGKSKKLILFCDQTDTHWVLRGIHITSNGRVIPDVYFEKKK